MRHAIRRLDAVSTTTRLLAPRQTVLGVTLRCAELVAGATRSGMHGTNRLSIPAPDAQGIYRLQFSGKTTRSFHSSSREPVPLLPKKVLIVSKVTLLNYESRKSYRKPWDRLNPGEKEQLSKHLELEGFHMPELIGSHGLYRNLSPCHALIPRAHRNTQSRMVPLPSPSIPVV
jgi:hypothetical protein